MGAAYQSSHRHISTLARVDITELHPRRAFAITVSEADFNRVGGGREPQAPMTATHPVERSHACVERLVSWPERACCYAQSLKFQQ